MFPRVTLALANGRSFVIEALDASRDNLYIQGCTLRDQPLEHAWLTHAEIMSGGTLRCAMGPAPSGFGTSGEPPPSLSTHGIP
jgi:putative alpha-1,2-mannosidase